MSGEPSNPPPLPSYYNTQYGDPAAQPPAPGKPFGEAPPPYFNNQVHYQVAPVNPSAPPPLPGYNGYQGQPTGVINVNAVQGPRFRCPHCNTVFVSRIGTRALVLCSGCRRAVSIHNRATCLGLTFLLVGLAFIALSVAITVLTLMYDTYIYYAWIGGYLIGISFTIRGVIALMVKEAKPEPPAA